MSNNVISRIFLVLLAACASVLRAQTTPTSTQPLPARSLLVGGGATTVDLRSHFGLPEVTGTVVQVDSVVGRFNLELFDDTPLSKANFLAYIEAGRYNNTIVHRSVAGFVVQAGGYFSRLPLEHIPTFGAVRNEFRRSNVRGTVAMAKVGGDPNSATSEWFVNLANNNAANLDNQNGGFTVFARVIGNGMSVVDQIAALPRYNVDNFSDFPLRNVQAGQTQVLVSNLVTVTNVATIPIYPSNGRGVLAFSAQSSNPGVATVAVADSALVLTPVAAGTTTVTVRATDTHNLAAESVFTLSVTGGATGGVAISVPPRSQHVQPGARVTFTAEAQAQGAVTYQWRRDGVAIAGATGASYTIPAAGAGDMGFYAVTATSGASSATSNVAVLTVAGGPVSRLVNVSTRGTATAAEPLTPGFVLRGTGTKNVVVRAVGPTLAGFGVADAMANPKMDIIPLGQSTAVLSNDDWGSASAAQVAALQQRSADVGAFALPANSRDAAALASLPLATSSGYTVSVAPSGTTAAGVVVAEVYDADGLGAAARVINVSTRGMVTADGLTPGFVIGGAAPKQLLIRAVGPTLASFGVGGTLADPTLSLFPLGRDFAVASNNDWSTSGAAELTAAFAQAGAFPLPAGSRDAAVLVRLPPGAYTAVTTGVGGTTGVALVEVYDLDP